jgi:hypothetical protein
MEGENKEILLDASCFSVPTHLRSVSVVKNLTTC